MAADPRTWIATLRESHDKLDSLVRPLTPEQVRGQSYDTDWSIAQVLSHLGSGAEIALMMLPGALGEAEPVGRDAFPAVWDVWNAKSPDEQAADGLASDEKHVQTLEALTDEQLAAVDMDFFGMMRLDAAGMVRMRLSEHVMHTWDVAVMADPAATVQADAVALLIDNVAAVPRAAPRQAAGRAVQRADHHHRSGPRLPADLGRVGDDDRLAGRGCRGRRQPRCAARANAGRSPPAPGLRAARRRRTRRRRYRATRTRWTSCGRSSPASSRS